MQKTPFFDRLGLAGYDIREASSAWDAVWNQRVGNPVIGSKRAAINYAFYYIGQYHWDVDYSKLKRGEAEYQEFLGELRKADPEAFAAKK